MNLKILGVITKSPASNHACYAKKMFYEDKFTPDNMKMFGRQNFGKHREINNGEKYVILEISLMIYFS